MQRDTFEELCSGYVLGALSTEEALEFERELAVADADARRFFEGVSFAALHLPLTVEMVTPPAHVKVKILQAIIPEPEPEPSAWAKFVESFGLNRPALAWSAAFLFLFGLFGSSFYAFTTVNQLTKQRGTNNELQASIKESKEQVQTLAKQNKTLTTKLTKARKQIKSMRMTLAKQEDLIKVLRGRQVQLVSMGATAKKGKAFGKVIWDPIGQKAVLQLANLPRPDKRVYHLWWIIKRRGKLKPIPAGFVPISETTPDTYHKINPKFLPKVRRRRRTKGIWAVTIEKGKATKPSAGPLVLGKVKIRL